MLIGLSRHSQPFSSISAVRCVLAIEVAHVDGQMSRYNEKMGRMVRGIDSTYEELFAYACPKFITAAPPNLDAPSSNTNQVASSLC